MKITEQDPATTAFYDALRAAEQGPSLPEGLKQCAPWSSPPEDWRDRTEFEFAGFVMHIHEDNCTSCGALTHWSDTFRAFTRKNDKSTTRLRPATHQLPEGAGITVFRIPVRQIPVCTHCLTATREGTAVYLVSDEAAWNRAKQAEREARDSARRNGIAKRNSEYTPVDLNSVPEDI